MDIFAFGALLAVPPIVATIAALFVKEPRWTTIAAGVAMCALAVALVTIAAFYESDDVSRPFLVLIALAFLLPPFALTVLIVTGKHIWAAERARIASETPPAE